MNFTPIASNPGSEEAIGARFAGITFAMAHVIDVPN
tara:strand:- start:3985 stop:4092 length:108 start_codon:yes stop_codon:yes gene_type:complete